MIYRIFPLLIVLLLTACSSEPPEQAQKTATQQEPPLAKEIPLEQQRSPFTSISAQEAKELIANTKDLLILDTRTTKEILTYGAIAGSQQASLKAIFQDQLPIPKNAPVLVVCAVGGRSYAAGQIMVRHGFQEIYNLRGGLDEWKAAGLPVVYPKQ